MMMHSSLKFMKHYVVYHCMLCPALLSHQNFLSSGCSSILVSVQWSIIQDRLVSQFYPLKYLCCYINHFLHQFSQIQPSVFLFPAPLPLRPLKLFSLIFF